MQRLFDILLALLALSFLAVPFLVVILILWITGEHNIWYRQDRVGLHGKHFRVFKFVTMRVGSEQKGNKDITVRDDPRVLPFGRILRMTKFNELPQVLNVLTGDMSIVGWRPLIPRGFSDYSDPVKEEIVKTKPGITGIGSIVFRDEEAIVSEAVAQGKDPHECYRDDILPHKGAVEIWYAKRRTLWLEMKIICLTAWAILKPGGVLAQDYFPGLPEPESDLVRAHTGYPPRGNAEEPGPPENEEQPQADAVSGGGQTT